ncbi:MAG: MBL fold metallo-hydrolase [Acidobacteria bacterium]|nr:MBL fold metallo-hydrolase [Acidobacteriota bacterium]
MKNAKRVYLALFIVLLWSVNSVAYQNTKTVKLLSTWKAHLAEVESAKAQEQEDWSKIQLKATKVAGSIYMIDMVEGGDGFAGGNIGVSIGSDGIVLVDDMFAPLAPKIFAVLKTLSDKPVRFVINTHVHGDHTSGNVAFGATATIIAHANTRQQLATQGADSKDKPVPAVALPVITVDERLTLHQNGEDIRLIHFPKAHSDTDVAVFFTQSNVVHLGDMYFSGMFPFIGRGGSIKGLIAAIEKVLNDIPANAKIIPGHGSLSNTVELRATLMMLKETSAIVEDGIKKKQSLKQMTEAKVFAKFDKWAHGYINADQFLEQMYKVLTR